ncbi:MAG: protein kinase [Sandaracinaceae bacterium]
MAASRSTLPGSTESGEVICLKCGSPRAEGRSCPVCADAVITMAGPEDSDGIPRTSGLIAIPDMDADGTLRAGAEVDAYVIEYLLGSGGVGNVYAARHAQLDRQVALKHLRPEVARNAKIVQRFFDEARAANRVRHENIVEITDFREHEEFGAYLIMERLDGQDLADLIFEMGQAIPVKRAIRIAQQTASALGAAHTAGIVHRDLKPDNIFLTPRGDGDFVKVLDFGVAKLGEGVASANAFKTAAGTLLGTPAYMAPEQAMGQPVDHRTDIYALGVILFEMLTGALPFDAETAGEFIVLHATSAPRAVTEFRSDAPAALVNLVERCLEKAPDDRPASMLEVEATLETVLRDPGPAALAPPAAPQFGSDFPTQPPAGEGGPETTRAALSETEREATARITMPMPEPTPRSPWWILGPAVAFSALALGAAFWIVSSREAPAPVAPVTEPAAPEAVEEPAATDEPEQAPAAPAQIEVVFRSTPSGATVRLEGQDEPLGQTPLSTTLLAREGTGRFTFELDGYQPHEEALSLDRDVLATVRLTRARRARPARARPAPAPSSRPTGRRGVLSF